MKWWWWNINELNINQRSICTLQPTLLMFGSTIPLYFRKTMFDFLHLKDSVLRSELMFQIFIHEMVI